METNESQRAPGQTGTPQPSETPAGRLVIRVKIVSEAPPPANVSGPLNRRALALVLGLALIAALALTWIATSVFRGDSSSTSNVSKSVPVESRSQATTPTRNESTPLLTDVPSSNVAPSTSETESPGATSIGPRDREGTSIATKARERSPSPLNEVIPDVPQSALQTIRGTVRVAIRVIFDKEGAVLAATSDVPGPSRYFERLSLEAAQKWTFTPADTEEPRVMLVRFHYTREGVTARANPPQ